MAHVLINGMFGMGDNLHQRAVVRYYMKRAVVWLPTPWPQLYHDLAGPNLKLLQPEAINLRTQAKNASVSTGFYANGRPPVGTPSLRVWYPPERVRAVGSVLGAMLTSTTVPIEESDFRLPVTPSLRAKARALVEKWRPTKPIMLYRPLVERTEWSGCHARNPDAYVYGRLAEDLAKRFFVVSIADLEPEREWIAGADIRADVKLHAGELDIDTLVGLTAAARLVYSAPGFAVVMAQAVGTASVCVFGGYEDSRSFSLGARYAPHLGIDTIRPCQCFKHNHACEKRIDLAAASSRVTEFVDGLDPSAANAA